GENTNSVTKGSCRYCGKYNSYMENCKNGYSIDFRSYIKYECYIGVEANIKIIVLYKSTYVNKTKCPEILKNRGIHIPMYKKSNDGQLSYNYNEIKQAFE